MQAAIRNLKGQKNGRHYSVAIKRIENEVGLPNCTNQKGLLPTCFQEEGCLTRREDTI